MPAFIQQHCITLQNRGFFISLVQACNGKARLALIQTGLVSQFLSKTCSHGRHVNIHQQQTFCCGIASNTSIIYKMFLHISFKSQTVDNLKTPFFNICHFCKWRFHVWCSVFFPHPATEPDNIQIIMYRTIFRIVIKIHQSTNLLRQQISNSRKFTRVNI